MRTGRWRCGRAGRERHGGGRAVGHRPFYCAEALEGRVLLSGEVGQVFITDDAAGTIGEYSTTGAVVNASLVTGLDGPSGIAVSGPDLFVANFGAGTIGEYSTSGATVNASLVTGLQQPDSIAVAGNDLFVTTGYGIEEFTLSGTAVNKTSGGITLPGSGTGICVAGSDLFVSEQDFGTVSEFDSTGATINPSVLSGTSGPDGLAVHGPDLFIANNYSNTISEYNTAGALLNASLVTGLAGPDGIAVAGPDLFVVNETTQDVGEYSTTGATLNASLVSGLDSPAGVCVEFPTGPAAQLAFSQEPGNSTVHNSFSPAISVNVEDAFNNLISSDTSNVTLSIASGPAGAVLSGTTTVAAAGGIATFSGIFISEAGTYTLTASEEGLTSGDSAICFVTIAGEIFVSDGQAGTIGAYTTSDGTVNASLVSGLDQPAGITVSGHDLFVVNSGSGTIGEYTTAGATVNASLVTGLTDPWGIAVSGPDLFVANQTAGTVGEYTTSGATLNVALIQGLTSPAGLAVSGSDLFVTSSSDDTVGEYTSTGAPVNASLVTGSSSFFSTQPPESPLGIAVSGQDLYVVSQGNSSLGEFDISGNTVNASLLSGLSSPADVLVAGPDLFVTTQQGLAEYASTGTLVQVLPVPAGDSGGYSGVCIDQAVGAAMQLAFAQQPLSTSAAIPAGPITVVSEDPNGVPVPVPGATITLSIASGPPNATFTGTTTATLQGGVAMFSGVSFSETGVYTLTASGAGIASAVSTPFNVTAIFVAGGNSVAEYALDGATINANLLGSSFNDIAASGPYLFVANGASGSIGVYSTLGATIDSSLISGLTGLSGIAVSGSDLFAMYQNPNPTFSEQLYSDNMEIGEYTIDGTAMNPNLITGLSGGLFAVSGSEVFVLHSYPTTYNQKDTGEVAVYSITGQTESPQSYITGLPYDSEAIAASGAHVFVASYSTTMGQTTTTIGEYDASTGATVNATLIKSAGFPRGLAILGNELFVGDESTSQDTIDEYSVSDGMAQDTSTGQFPLGGFAVEVPRLSGPASDLTVGQESGQILAGLASIPPLAVDVDDNIDNIIATDSSAVTLSITTAPFGGKLGGTTTVAAQQGVATFSDLTFSVPGAYSLTAKDGTLKSVTFAITVAEPTAPVVTQQPMSQTEIEDNTLPYFSVAASGTPTPNVQWQVSTDGGTTFQDVPGATSTDFTVPFSAGQNGNEFRAVFTNVEGSVTTTPADLTVEQPSTLLPELGMAILPATVIAGTPLRAKMPVTLTNDGGNLRGKTTIDLYAETGEGQYSGGTLVAMLGTALSLPAGKARTFNVPIKSFPATLAAGTYYLRAEVTDPSGLQRVSTTTQTVQVSAPYASPHVTVGSPTPATIKPGGSGTLAVTVLNDGNVPGSSIELTLSAPPPGGYPGNNIPIQTLRSGATIRSQRHRTFKIRFKLPATLTAGSFYPIVSVTLAGVTNEESGDTPIQIS